MNKRTILVIVSITILAGISGWGFWYWQNNATQTKTTQTGQDEQTKVGASVEAGVKAISEEDLDISKWKTYRNEEYGFEIKYPGNIFDIQEISGLELTVRLVERGYPVGEIGRTIVLRFNQLHGEKTNYLIDHGSCATVSFRSKDGRICALADDELNEQKRRFNDFVNHGVCGGWFEIWFDETFDENANPDTFSFIDVNCAPGNPLEKMYKAIYDSIWFFPKQSSD